MKTSNRASLQSIADDSELVLDFFATFSRIEGSLKRSGFATRNSCDSAIADWNKFADNIQTKVNASTETAFTSSKTFLFANPPNLQKYDSATKAVTWVGNAIRLNESATRYLLRLVRDVRNNLFHGGKYPSGPVNGAALRSAELLQN